MAATKVDLPRALSVDPDDPRYDSTFAKIGGVDVWLNGTLQQHVVTYDIDEGVIIKADLDDRGDLQLNEARDAILRVRCEGVVRVAAINPRWRATVSSATG